MDLAAVMDEIAELLSAIPEVNVVAYPPATVTPPQVIVSYPERIVPATYNRGAEKIEGLSIVVVAGRVSDLSTRDRLSDYARGSGQRSIAAALDAGPYASFDDLAVTRVEFDSVTIASATYMSALFIVDVIGSGS